MVSVKVENRGPGRAYGVKLVASSETADIETGPALELGTMEPNTTQTMSVPVHALLSCRGRASRT